MFCEHEENEGANAVEEWNIPEYIQRLLMKKKITRKIINGEMANICWCHHYTESEINESYLMSILVWVKSTVEYLSKTERD